MLLALACLAVTGKAMADKPLWEAGAGVAAVNFPDYRGSDQRRSYMLPVPYIVYRGEFLKVEREKVRGLLFKSEKTELDISVNGAVPVKSSKNRARAGMPNLSPSFEIGPSLNLTLFRSENKNSQLDLRLPLRPVFAVSSSGVRNEGWLFQPQINLDLRNISALPEWNVGILTGPIFGDTRYHQYVYGVEPAYATPTRPAYQARGGYAGMQFISAISKRSRNYWMGAFIKLDTLNGAVFADSPLVRSRTNASAGFAISWVLDVSKTMVKDEE